MSTDLALSIYSTASIVLAAGERASVRFAEFFAAHIRNPNTRRAYLHAVGAFLDWCQRRGLSSLAAVQPLHVAAYIELLTRSRSAPTTKQHLAAIRMLFDWLVVGQVVPLNPASSVRGPRHVVKKGKTPVLAPDEARALLDSIDLTTPAGLRDRALIGLMTYTFARIGAATAMQVKDVFLQNRRHWVRLHEKGGKEITLPCHHNLEDYLLAYIDGCGLRAKPNGPLFCTVHGGRGGSLTDTPLPTANAWAMIQRRVRHAGIGTHANNHTFRATGITAYLTNGGTLEKGAAIANHASTRTTQLYDRRSDDVNLDELERILI